MAYLKISKRLSKAANEKKGGKKRKKEEVNEAERGKRSFTNSITKKKKICSRHY